MKECNHNIVKTCIDHGYNNSNSFIGRKLSIFRYKFAIDILNDSFKICSRHVSQPILSLEQYIMLDQLKTFCHIMRYIYMHMYFFQIYTARTNYDTDNINDLMYMYATRSINSSISISIAINVYNHYTNTS